MPPNTARCAEAQGVARCACKVAIGVALRTGVGVAMARRARQAQTPARRSGNVASSRPRSGVARARISRARLVIDHCSFSSRAVFGRSLALRPRLATGVPLWWIGRRGRLVARRAATRCREAAVDPGSKLLSAVRALPRRITRRKLDACPRCRTGKGAPRGGRYHRLGCIRPDGSAVAQSRPIQVLSPSRR